MTPLALSFSLDFATLLPLAVFGLVATAAWLIFTFTTKAQPRAEERLDEFRQPRNRGAGGEELKKKSDAMTKVLSRASPLAKPLQPKSEEEVSRLRVRLANAGFRSEGGVATFLGLKLVGLGAGVAVAAVTVLAVTGVSQKSMLYGLLGAGLMFYLPDVIVWLFARNRKDQIFMGLPDALDLLVVCVESGLGLDQAMRKVAEEMKTTCKVIADEFSLSNLHLQMGRPRDHVLHDLGLRTGVDDVRSLAAILIQADKFGSSVATALRVQSDAMRTRRRQLAEEKAAKTAVKLIFPLVIFIFPGIFVVLVGPAAITMVREMFPAMNKQ